MKALSFIVIIFIAILFCNATYEYNKNYEDPIKKGSKSCLLQCTYMKENCSNRCRSKQQHGCILDGYSHVDPFEILYKDKCYSKRILCTKNCPKELLCPQICENNWYNCQKEDKKDLDCSDRCIKKCQLKYDNCFTNCGGKIHTL